MPRLDIYQRGALLLQLHINDEPLWIGRGQDCQLSLNDIEISRKHALISKKGDGWEIFNQGRNGTRLNTDQLKDTAPLNFGDRIYLGSHAMVFQADDAPVLKQSAALTAMTIDVRADDRGNG